MHRSELGYRISLIERERKGERERERERVSGDDGDESFVYWRGYRNARCEGSRV